MSQVAFLPSPAPVGRSRPLRPNAFPEPVLGKGNAPQVQSLKVNGYGRKRLAAGGMKAASLCGLSLLSPEAGAEWQLIRGDQERVTGRRMCGNPCCCPECARITADARVAVLQPQVSDYVTAGRLPYVVSLTIRHELGDTLAALNEILFRAWRAFTSSQVFRQYRAEFSRGWDYTYSAVSGHHPHFHMVLLPFPGTDGDVMWRELRELWLRCVSRAGGSAESGGQDCQLARDADAVAAYSNKTSFGLVEVNSGAVKRRSKNYTIADITGLTECGGPFFCELYEEIVRATKDRRLFTVSRGLSLSEVPEGVEARTPEVPAVELVTFFSTKALRRFMWRREEFSALLSFRESEPIRFVLAVRSLMALLPKNSYRIGPVQYECSAEVLELPY